MALYCYLHFIENAGIDPLLSQSVPPSVLIEVSKEVKKIEAWPNKCGTYLTVNAEEKARVVRHLNIGSQESQNLKPRKLILKTCDSFSQKFGSPKITRYTVCIVTLWPLRLGRRLTVWFVLLARGSSLCWWRKRSDMIDLLFLRSCGTDRQTQKHNMSINYID